MLPHDIEWNIMQGIDRMMRKMFVDNLTAVSTRQTVSNCGLQMWAKISADRKKVTCMLLGAGYSEARANKLGLIAVFWGHKLGTIESHRADGREGLRIIVELAD